MSLCNGRTERVHRLDRHETARDDRHARRHLTFPRRWLANLALVAITAWAVRETREARLQEVRERRRGAIRAALAEASDNCRQWMSRRPGRHSDLHQPSPRFDALTALLGATDLPPELVAHFVWTRGYSSTLDERFAACLTENDQVQSQVCGDLWNAQLERLQVVACLLRAHAAADKDLKPVADSFEFAQWMRPVVYPVERPDIPGRLLAYESLRLYEGAPPFPGNEHYRACSHDARDDAARSGSRRAGVAAQPASGSAPSLTTELLPGRCSAT